MRIMTPNHQYPTTSLSLCLPSHRGPSLLPVRPMIWFSSPLGHTFLVFGILDYGAPLLIEKLRFKICQRWPLINQKLRKDPFIG